VSPTSTVHMCVCTYHSKATQQVEGMNHEQSTSSVVTTRMETTHSLTYLVATTTEVTAWQSVNIVCHFLFDSQFPC